MISFNLNFSSLHLWIHSIFRTFLDLRWMMVEITTIPVTHTELSNGIDFIISSTIHQTLLLPSPSLSQGNSVCTIPDPSLSITNTESFIMRIESTHPATVTVRRISEDVKELQGHDFNGSGQWVGSREISNTDEKVLSKHCMHREIGSFRITPSILTYFLLQKSERSIQLPEIELVSVIEPNSYFEGISGNGNCRNQRG